LVSVTIHGLRRRRSCLCFRVRDSDA
jgi:hypothetical protein